MNVTASGAGCSDFPEDGPQEAVDGARRLLVVLVHLVGLAAERVPAAGDAAGKGNQDVALAADLVFCAGVAGDDLLVRSPGTKPGQAAQGCAVRGRTQAASRRGSVRSRYRVWVA